MLLRYGVWLTEFVVILDHFLPFHPPNNPKNQHFEKMKNTPGGNIILHKCTINDNHMMYGSWDMERVRQKWQSYDVWFLRYEARQTEFFVIFNYFLPFYLTHNPQNQKFWKNEKNTWRYYWFTLVYHKWQSYHVWFLRYGAWLTKVFVILDHFLPFSPPNNPKNQNFQKS